MPDTGQFSYSPSSAYGYDKPGRVYGGFRAPYPFQLSGGLPSIYQVYGMPSNIPEGTNQGGGGGGDVSGSRPRA